MAWVYSACEGALWICRVSTRGTSRANVSQRYREVLHLCVCMRVRRAEGVCAVMPSGLAASFFPSLQSQEADCRGIPITLARDAPLSRSLASFPLLPASSSAPLFPSEVDNKDILGVLLDVRPALDLFSLCFLYLSVALLSYSTSTIFTLQKTKPGWIFHAGQGPSERTNHPAMLLLRYLARLIRYQG